jgi:D-serine deaminase-like pyridoxal phosphate-dependent protein
MKYLDDDQLAVAIECDRQSQRTGTVLPQTSQNVEKSLSFSTEEYLQRYGLFTDSKH